MSTRSNIAVERTNGTIASIYCHYDGYLSNNGRKLMENWHHPARVAQLIALGDLSSLGKVIGGKHDFDWRDELREQCQRKDGTTDHDKYAALQAKLPWVVEDWCMAYHRDRGEPWNPVKDKSSGVRPLIYESEAALMAGYEDGWCEYLYLFRDGTWWLWEQRQFAAWTTDDKGELQPVWETRIPAYWRTLYSALIADEDTTKDGPIRPGPRPYLRSRYRDGHTPDPTPIIHTEGRRAVLI